MTEKISKAWSKNAGHVLTFVIAVVTALCTVLVACGKMDQRQTDSERRVAEVERTLPELTRSVSRMEGKIDMLVDRSRK